MEKISLIVTVYNRLEYLRTVIYSVLNQTKMIDELIIADDGSREKVMDFIGDLIEDCPFSIKHVTQEDLGFRLARSRNNAARTAEGDFLIFIDQDIIFPNDFIEKLYETRAKKRMVFSRAVISLEEEKEAALAKIVKGYEYSDIYQYFRADRDGVKSALKRDVKNNFLYRLKLRTRGAKIAGLIFALYKEDFINVNGLDEKFIGWGEEDDDLCNRFYKYGGMAIPVMYDEYPVHLFHPFDNSKRKSPNRDYYIQRKKEISRKNYRSEYGYDHPYGDDRATVIKLK